ncbi:MAG: hypothetical protein ABIK48_04580 [candidate division WOR-3 bacterium]
MTHLFLLIITVFWPVPPENQVHPLGNNWGEFQDYGGGAYFHNGIDILTPDTSGVEVRAVAPGWVKAWGTIQAELHYRIAVCDSPLTFTGRAEGWLYAHIDPNRYHKNLGDPVAAGDIIGYLVAWPVDSSFDHIHFARISDTGATWQRFPSPTWWFVQNPLLVLNPNTDLEPPVFENARAGWRFAFCRDNQNNRYLHPDSLNGDVDIIARIFDRTGFSSGSQIWDRLAPYQIEYMIRREDGLVVVPWTLSVQFSNLLDGGLVNVVYKTDNVCRSRGDYSSRQYYFIITNTDGDSVIEATDTAGRWSTALLGDAGYWVIVRAADVAGNITVDSMLVHTRNGVGVNELAGVDVPPVFNVVPILASGRTGLMVRLVRPAPVKLRLIDPAGRVVQALDCGQMDCGIHRLELKPVEPGVYNLEITTGRFRRFSRLIITG